MNTYVILLRGVNVGGSNLLPMKELKTALLNNGFENVKTYIQSGNIVLASNNNPENEISSIIESNFGFRPQTMVLTNDEFALSVSNNPYQEFEGKFVHFYFCKATPKLNSVKIKQLSSKTESHILIDNVFYLHAPDGIGRSKLVAKIEACLGVSATGRNLNTITKLEGLLKEV